MNKVCQTLIVCVTLGTSLLLTKASTNHQIETLSVLEETAEYWSQFLPIVADSLHTGTPTPPPHATVPPPTTTGKQTPKNCDILLSIACTSADGIECSHLNLGNGQCSPGEKITSITLRYTGCPCMEQTYPEHSLFNCEEFNGGLTGDPVYAVCTGSGEIETKSTNLIQLEETFTVSEPNGLSSRLSCILSSLEGNVLQVVSFDASESNKLNLNDRFGGLTLEAYGDALGTCHDCRSDITWRLEAMNMGTSEMNVTILDIQRGTDIRHLHSTLEMTKIAPTQTVAATFEETLDLCLTGEVTTLARAVAECPHGEEIMVEATHDIQLTPNTECGVSLNVGCKIPREDKECDQASSTKYTQCECPTCVNELSFRYNGKDTLDIVDLFVVDSDFHVVFMGRITVGETVVISSDPCLDDIYIINLADPDSGAEFAYFEVDTLCNGTGLALLDSIGPLDFIGYSCAGDANPHDCLLDIELQYMVENVAEDTIAIKSIKTTLDGTSTELTMDTINVELELRPGERFERSVGSQIDLCGMSQVSISSLVTAKSLRAATVCNDQHSFEALNHSPSLSPSLQSLPSTGHAPAETCHSCCDSQPNSRFTPQLPHRPPTENRVHIPSPPPPPPNTAHECELKFEIGCVPPVNASDCEAIPTSFPVCQQSPSAMTLRFTGDNCSSSHHPTEGSFQCEDFLGDLAYSVPTTVYITASAQDDSDVYFEGFVNVNQTFALLSGDKSEIKNLKVSIYQVSNWVDSIENIQPQNLLQTLKMDCSCTVEETHTLSVADQFGSIQVVEFVNEQQGIVSGYQEIMLTFKVGTPKDPLFDDGDIDLTAMLVVTDLSDGNDVETSDKKGYMDLSNQVAGKVVRYRDGNGGSVVVVEKSFEIDLTRHQEYFALSTVVGRSESGNGCFGSTFYRFTAGNAHSAQHP